jgi:P-type Cu2+ transporter
LFFLLIGRTLDHMMRAKARDAVGRLGRLAAKGGLVIGRDGSINYSPLEKIKPGMILRVAVGERIPVDGTVVDGMSDVDRSLVTGESAPLRAEPGIALEAGTLNLTGAIDIRADRDARASFLADVMQMMQAAEQGRGLYVRVAERMAKLYAPVVHLLALCTFTGWMTYTHGGWHDSFTAAISVLIITCPCALGLAVPVAHVVAAGRLLSLGILMKDGSALERLAEIDRIVFDKTGTLTSNFASIRRNTIAKGKPSAIAKALALRSIHPGARALASAISEAPIQNLRAFHEVPGYGVEAELDGKAMRLGRMEWVSELAARSHAHHLPKGIGFCVQDGPLFAAQLDEELRPGVSAVIHAFNQAGIESEILSGDVSEAVQRAARVADIKKFKFALKPGDKVSCIKALAKTGHKVLMVGDGLNDAPALAAAHVSMAPSSASDTGRMVADFVFTGKDLSAVWQAYQISKCAGRIVKQNFAMALIYNALAVPLAISGSLNPLIAAIAMSISSILVVGNSLRLRLLRIDERKPASVVSGDSQTVRKLSTI